MPEPLISIPLAKDWITTLARQGLLGIAVPEAQGGSGLGLVELCLLLEEQGRRVAPVPVLASLVLGGLAIAEFGDEQQKSTWLPGLAGGQLKLLQGVEAERRARNAAHAQGHAPRRVPLLRRPADRQDR